MGTHTDLIRYRAGGLVGGPCRAQFVHHGIGQRQGHQQPDGHQQPSHIHRPVAHLTPQKLAHQQHQQDQQAAKQCCLQQKVEHCYRAEG